MEHRDLHAGAAEEERGAGIPVAGRSGARRPAGDAGPTPPHGYNIGVNVGEAAGQTVAHLHVHVIPRYRGDVVDPRGGVRHVIPGKGNYLAGK